MYRFCQALNTNLAALPEDTIGASFVASSPSLSSGNDLPHQIMNACGLGLKDLALGSNMLWDCLTCYQCQEQCPQGVCVTDILYELKNEAVQQVKEKPLMERKL